MIDRRKLEASIKPGTSQSLIDWILFTNRHHHDTDTQEEIIKEWRGTILGDHIDFDILEGKGGSKEEPSPRRRETGGNK